MYEPGKNLCKHPQVDGQSGEMHTSSVSFTTDAMVSTPVDVRYTRGKEGQHDIYYGRYSPNGNFPLRERSSGTLKKIFTQM